MLRVAGSCGFCAGRFPKVRARREKFDVAARACNSLNYACEIGELAPSSDVSRSTFGHKGLCVFDTITEAGMKVMSGFYLHVQLDDIRFAIHFEYDKKSRKDRAEVLMPFGSEVHSQIPIDPADVVAAAKNSGLVLDDYFSHAHLPGWWCTTTGSFFVLRREAE